MTVTWRKNKESGKWQVFGPSAEVQVGEVRVTRKNGKTAVVNVKRVSREFMIDGVPHRYGYIDDDRERADGRAGERHSDVRGEITAEDFGYPADDLPF